MNREYIRGLRQLLAHRPTVENVCRLLDDYGFKAQRARTTQLIFGGKTQGWAYFENGYGKGNTTYLLPYFRVAVIVLPFHGRVIIKLSQDWAEKLDDLAITETKYK